jgi:hypothetical protein
MTAAIVQEPCILAMIRVSVHCDEIPSDVGNVIDDISRTADHVVQSVRVIPILMVKITDSLPLALRSVH